MTGWWDCKTLSEKSANTDSAANPDKRSGQFQAICVYEL